MKPLEPPIATLPLGTGTLRAHRGGSVPAVPPHLQRAFAPATHCLYEWAEYVVEHPEADRLRVGGAWGEPLASGVFVVQFKNQLGLASLRLYKGTRPLHPPASVEVLSPKFPAPEQHLTFYRTLLDDLFVRAARLPFALAAETARGVRKSLRPPSPLFTLHYLLQHGERLRTALSTMLGAPHRRLLDHPAWVPLPDASEADADVLAGILRAPQELVRAWGFPLAERLGGYAPARVWQRLPEESFDTPENRFVLHFLRELRTAAGALPGQPWWGSVPPERRRVVGGVASALREAGTHGMWAEVGRMHAFPAASRVLQRREGYRAMLELWTLFHRARRPLFEPLRHAMDVRDVATLYEVWVYFALVEEIAVLLDRSPVLELRMSDAQGLRSESVARFGDAGELVYNRTFRRGTAGSYSVTLRPDFTWRRGGKADVVLDAKFRLDRAALEDESDDTPQATAKRADLYKMHTYRDALGVRAAVIVYPGDRTMFYHRAGNIPARITLRALLEDGLSGVGALPMQP